MSSAGVSGHLDGLGTGRSQQFLWLWAFAHVPTGFFYRGGARVPQGCSLIAARMWGTSAAGYVLKIWIYTPPFTESFRAFYSLPTTDTL